MSGKVVRKVPDVDDPTWIDSENLFEECRLQPYRVRQARRRLAKLIRAVSKAEAKKKLVEADLMLEVRSDPQKYDLPLKPSNDLVKAKVLSMNTFRAAWAAVIDAEYERDYQDAEVRALWDRKGMLEKCVEMHMTGWHSEPNPRTTADAARDGRTAIPRRSK
jgi:hypothetical protein